MRVLGRTFIYLSLLLLPLPVLGIPIAPLHVLFPTSTNPAYVSNWLSSYAKAQPKPKKKGKLADNTPKQEELKNAAKIKFVLKKIVLTGNVVYSTDTLLRNYKPLLNKQISVATLEQIVNNITDFYHENGYILSQAILPPQHIKNGVVHIHVIEGFVKNVGITGPPLIGAAAPALAVFGQQITASHPLSLDILERNLLLSGDVPGVDVQGVLNPSKTQGAADLLMVSEFDRFNWYIRYNNYGTRYFGPIQFNAGLSINSLMLPGDNIYLNATTLTHTQNLIFYQGIYQFPISASGTTIQAGGNYNEVRPQYNLEPLDVVGRAHYWFLTLNHPFIRKRHMTLNGNFGFTAITNYQSIFGIQAFLDELRILAAGIDFQVADEAQGLNNIRMQLQQGLPCFGASGPPSFNHSRPKGLADFTLIDFTYTRLQGITPNLSLLVSADSQYGFNPQLAPTQYGYGGMIYGRGYDPYEIAGDSGLATKVQLNLDFFPQVLPLQHMQIFLFYDAGMVWNRDTITQYEYQSATSTGIGFHFDFTPHFAADALVAKPLTLPVQAVVGNQNAIRAFFNFTLQG